MRTRLGRSVRLSLTLFCVALSVGLLAAEVSARGRGGGGRSRPNVSRGGPASHGSMRPSRSPGGSGRRSVQTRPAGSRRPVHIRRDRVDDHREFRSDRAEFRQDVRSERREWYEDRWRYNVGARLTLATYRSLSCRTTVIVVDRVAYYRCGTDYYRRYVHGGSVTYVVVVAPN